MGTPSPAATGAATTAIGTGINAYGQHQGLAAMQDVWDSNRKTQGGFDRQLQQKIQALIGQSGGQQALGTEYGNQQTAQLNTGAKNIATAVKGQAGKRTAGSRSGPESQANLGRMIQTGLAEIMKDNRLRGILAGIMHGGQNQDMLGRQFGLDANNIRSDARGSASMIPMQERAAGMTGSGARQVGNLFNTLGQAGMQYGMSQPVDDGGMASMLRMQQSRPGSMSER